MLSTRYKNSNIFKKNHKEEFSKDYAFYFRIMACRAESKNNSTELEKQRLSDKVLLHIALRYLFLLVYAP
jgi:hypothetical protein